MAPSMGTCLVIAAEPWRALFLKFQSFDGIGFESRAFDSTLEFNAGDIGQPDGIQALEAANANPTNKCAMVRCGGSTRLSISWPVNDDEDAGTDDFDKLEKMIQKAMQVASTEEAAAVMNSSMDAESSGVQTGGSGEGGGIGGLEGSEGTSSKLSSCCDDRTAHELQR